MEPMDPNQLMRATVQIAVAYVRRTSVPASGLAPVLKDIHRGLANLGQRQEPEPATLVPAVSIRRSVTDDTVTCLECGRPMKLLKGHLRAEHALTVAEYRKKWGLNSSHPVVAPSYSRQRSETAKLTGLGQKPEKRRPRKRRPRKTAPVPEAVQTAAAEAGESTET